MQRFEHSYQQPYRNMKVHQEEEGHWKRKRNNRLKLLSVVLIGFLLWAGTEWISQAEKIEDRQQELQKIQAQVEQANQEQTELIYQVKRLHDKDYIAEIARSQYFLSRPGEMIFKIPNE